MLRALFVIIFMAAGLWAADPAGHRFAAADRERGRLAIIGRDGKVEWEMPMKHDVHDLHVLANGNILTHTSHTRVVEIAADRSIVWSYDSKPTSPNGRVEVHAFERLADGNTMIAESGNMRIIEVNPRGEIVKTVPLAIAKPNAHRDTRMVRKLASGNYLVCQEGDGLVREYDAAGKTIWEYKLDLNNRPRAPGHGVEGHGVEVFGAIRLKNGHTLIGGGNNNRVIEVNPKGEIVWQVDQKDLPGITLAWVTTLHALPNGNIVIGNCHAGPENPQLIEISREKQVVWQYKNHSLFGNNLAACHILGDGIIR
jgi:hypothetical protein